MLALNALIFVTLSIGENDNAGVPYFFNCTTGQSVWTHPNEKLYFEKVKIAKEQLKFREQGNTKSGFSGPKELSRPTEKSNTSLHQESSHGFRTSNNRNSSRFSDDNDAVDEVLDFSDIDDANSDTAVSKSHNNFNNNTKTVNSGMSSNTSDAAIKKPTSMGFGLTDDDFLDNDNETSAVSNVSNQSAFDSLSSPQRQELSSASQHIPNRVLRDTQDNNKDMRYEINNVNKDRNSNGNEAFFLTTTSPNRRDSDDESVRDDNRPRSAATRPLSNNSRPSLSVAFEDDDRRSLVTFLSYSMTSNSDS